VKLPDFPDLEREREGERERGREGERERERERKRERDRLTYIEPATFKEPFEASEGVPLMFYRRFHQRAIADVTIMISSPHCRFGRRPNLFFSALRIALNTGVNTCCKARLR